MLINITLLFIFSLLTSTLIAHTNKSLYISKYHIHHWIWGTILLIISLIYGNIWFSTILLGIVVEGLLYSDRFVI